MAESDEPVVLELDGTSWEKLVEKASLPVSVMFFTPTCPHCRVIRPYFTEYAKEFKGKMVFALLNVAAFPWLGERYGIRGTPTFKFFCNGKPVQELVGAVYPAILKKMAENVLKYGSECVRNSTEIDYEISGYG